MLHPDPLPTEEVLLEVEHKLNDFPASEVVEEVGVVVGIPQATDDLADPPAARMPDNAAVVNFEDEDGADVSDRSMMDACRNLERFEWQPEDLLFYFNQVEAKMNSAGVKKNYTKFQVLSTIVPRKVQDQVKPLLRMQATDFPNKDSYKQLKAEILRIFGPRPERAVERALGRVLSGQPSELARDLVNDLSKCKPQLQCACCPAIITHLWKRHLPPQVRAGIAKHTLTQANFNEVVTLADDIFSSNTPAPAIAAYGVAAVSAPVQALSLDETQPAIPYVQPEVAGIQRGRGRGRGNRGRGGRGRGGSAPAAAAASGGQRHKGTKHPDLPAGEWTGCSMHFRFGRSAHFCNEPATCPWKNVFTPKTNNK